MAEADRRGWRERVSVVGRIHRNERLVSVRGTCEYSHMGAEIVAVFDDDGANVLEPSMSALIVIPPDGVELFSLTRRIEKRLMEHAFFRQGAYRPTTAAAAEWLGINRTTLHERLKRKGLQHVREYGVLPAGWDE